MKTAKRVSPTAPVASAPEGAGLDWRSACALRAAFFCSGAAALCYQVVWLRKLATFFGNTTLATSVCLAAFMAGLALGSYLLGRWAERMARPFRRYAALELGIGAYGLASLPLMDAVRSAYLALARHLPLDSPALVSFQFLSCFLVLLLPTALMGGTLPVAIKGVVRGREAVGREVAWLYGVNTLGAAAGALLVGFFLLPRIGLRGSVVFAALLNLAATLAAFRLDARGLATAGQPASRAPRSEPRAPAPLSRLLLVILVAGFGLSGFSGLALEVVWARALCLLTGSSIYAFSGVLFAVLVGIALGSLLTTRLFTRHQATPAWFAAVEIGAGLSTLALALIYPRLPFVFQRLVLDHPTDIPRLLTDQLGLIFAFLFVPTLLAGASFPILSRLYVQDAARVSRGIGTIYAANTVGCIVGAFAGGFLLIPRFGLHATVILCAALYIVAGAAVLLIEKGRARMAGGLALAVLASAVFLLPSWRPATMSVGVFDLRVARRDIQDESAQELVYYREGSTCTVSVFDEHPWLVLKVNGKVDASSTEVDAITQALLAHLPLLLADRTDSVLVVGLGSGATAGGATQHPVSRIDCVEIEPAVADAASYFTSINHEVFSDPRFHLIFADARNYLATTLLRYDVITAEPSNPWVAGVSSLFTVEHFRACRERLTEDGIICQWFHFYEMGRAEVRSVIASFLKVFPDTTLWSADDRALDVLLIAKKHPWKVNYAQLAQRLERLPSVSAELHAIELDSPEQVLASLLRGPADLRQISRGGALNTDDFPRLEFAAPLYLNDDTVYEGNLRLLIESQPQSRDAYVDFGGPRSAELRHRLADAMVSRYRTPPELQPAFGLARAELSAACEQAPRRADLLEELSNLEQILGDTGSARRHAQQALALDPTRATARAVLDHLGP